jgi:hypothetical protein
MNPTPLVFNGISIHGDSVRIVYWSSVIRAWGWPCLIGGKEEGGRRTENSYIDKE